MSEYMLLFIILIEGFVTISAEILTIRQLMPMVGNSVVVTSLIIGVFLLFLAYGYQRGGRYQNDKDYVAILKRNFSVSAIWLGIGLSYSLIQVFFEYFKLYISREALFALTAYLLLVTAPLVYILGQTVPITMNLLKSGQTTGAIGGRVLHLSTIGSFFGSVLTSLVLMNYLGVAWSVLINYLLLTVLVFLLFTNIKSDFIYAFFLIAMMVGIYRLNILTERHLFVKTNSCANYKVLHHDGHKYLQSNGSVSSVLSDDQKGFSYIEFIKNLLFKELRFRHKEILVLGAGGFTLSAENDHHNHFTYVDIDKNIKEIVEKHFSGKVNGEFVVSDARAYLNSTDHKYDAIVSDVYSNRRAIPPHLLTREYFAEIKDHLRPDGVAIINIKAHPSLADDYSHRIDNTIRIEFNSCMVTPIQHDTVANIIYVCRNHPQHLKSNYQYYSDDLNRSTLDFSRLPDSH